jgi:hypothetical protein
MRATPYGYNLDGDIQTPKFFKGLNMQKVHALRGRLIFSLCFSKNFQFAPALSVNFKKGHWFDFFMMCYYFLQVALMTGLRGTLTH